MLLTLTIQGSSFKDLQRKIQLANNDLAEFIDSGEADLSNGPAAASVGTSVGASVVELPHSQPAVSSIPSAATPPAETAAPSANVEIDARGFEWDQRIHSAQKTKNNDNTWRYKRGLTDPVIKEVESRMVRHSVAAAPVAAQVTETLPVPQQTVSAPAPAPLPTPVAVVQPTVVAPPPIPQPAAGPPMHSLVTFKNNLIEIIAQFINEGKINQGYVNQLVDYFKVTNPDVKAIHNILGNEKQCIELFSIFVKAGWIIEVQ